jgi:hypothetical protein
MGEQQERKGTKRLPVVFKSKICTKFFIKKINLKIVNCVHPVPVYTRYSATGTTPARYLLLYTYTNKNLSQVTKLQHYFSLTIYSSTSTVRYFCIFLIPHHNTPGQRL